MIYRQLHYLSVKKAGGRTRNNLENPLANRYITGAMNMIKPLLIFVLLGLGHAMAEVVVHPTAPGEMLSGDYLVSVRGHRIPVRFAETLHGEPASFAIFDFSDRVSVTIAPSRQFKTARVWPASLRVAPRISGRMITFELSKPANVTLELDGSFERVLHLFAGPIERTVPKPGDSNVLYFGPGLHDIGSTNLHSGQTLYLAGGAVLRARLEPDEKPDTDRFREPVFGIVGAKGVSIRGRGIIDLSQLPWPSKCLFKFQDCTNILVEGITVIDSPGWQVAVHNSTGVTVRNVRQISHRQNSDGIDLCNTQEALVEDCFLRDNDDEVSVKTTAPAPAQESKNILVRNCVIWNERARALGITSETRRDISNVTFRDCDVIRDFSMHAPLAVLVSDSGTMRNIVFENIRVNCMRDTLVHCWVGADQWGSDQERGRIDGVVFRKIRTQGSAKPWISLAGFDPEHRVENVLLENIRVAGRPIKAFPDPCVWTNGHTGGVLVTNTGW